MTPQNWFSFEVGFFLIEKTDQTKYIVLEQAENLQIQQGNIMQLGLKVQINSISQRREKKKKTSRKTLDSRTVIILKADAFVYTPSSCTWNPWCTTRKNDNFFWSTLKRPTERAIVMNKIVSFIATSTARSDIGYHDQNKRMVY